MSPACSALISKAVPIFATRVVNPIKSFLAIPSCPPLAVILASSVGNRGIVWESLRISAPKVFNSSLESKSTTFFTSAIELSKSIAAFMGIAILAPIAAFSTKLDLKLSILPCTLSSKSLLRKDSTCALIPLNALLSLLRGERLTLGVSVDFNTL